MASQNGQPIWPYRIIPASRGHVGNPSKVLHFIAEDSILPDPFTEPFPRPGVSRRTCSTVEDVSMPDYISTSTSSRALSSMTGISYEHKRQAGPNAFVEEHLNQVIEAMNPGKLTVNRASNIPTIISKPSAAAKARSASYTKSLPSSIRSREASFSGTREMSGSSTKSGSAIGSVIEKRTTQKTLDIIKGIDTDEAEKSHSGKICEVSSNV
jgi:hypothetical protein